MSSKNTVYLKDRRSGQFLEATLIDGITKNDVVAADAQWKPFLQEQIKRMQHEGVPRDKWPQHRHWDWRDKQEVTEGYLAYQMFGIECESQMQGLMLVTTAGHACRITSQIGKPLIYISFLAAAPWNLPSIVSEPRFSLAGSVLLAAAINLSVEEEFAGRIGLHSLPQADKWYSKSCGMTDLGIDKEAHNLRYFEMTPQQASEFLK